MNKKMPIALPHKNNEVLTEGITDWIHCDWWSNSNFKFKESANTFTQSTEVKEVLIIEEKKTF